jgi:hypothetical protein
MPSWDSALHCRRTRGGELGVTHLIGGAPALVWANVFSAYWVVLVQCLMTLPNWDGLSAVGRTRRWFRRMRSAALTADERREVLVYAEAAGMSERFRQQFPAAAVEVAPVWVLASDHPDLSGASPAEVVRVCTTDTEWRTAAISPPERRRCGRRWGSPECGAMATW